SYLNWKTASRRLNSRASFRSRAQPASTFLPRRALEETQVNDLVLDVRLDGFQAPIGVLARDAKGAMAFVYTDAHLKHPAPVPLSLSLPLQEAGFADEAARPYFENLLQERDGALKQVMDRENLSRDDIAGLLFHLGR